MVKGEGYYSEPERRRVGSSMALGGRGLERVECVGGFFYLQSND